MISHRSDVSRPDRPILLQNLLERAAIRHPDTDALRGSGRGVTYGELDQQATDIGRLFTHLGVTHNDRIAVHLAKTLQTPVVLYGVLKAGAAYVPIDVSQPVIRAVRILDDCRASGLVTTCSAAADLLRACTYVPLFVILVDARAPVDLPRGAVGIPLDHGLHFDPSPADVSSSPDDLAYILYTSGSTGTPKGVAMSHAAALSFVEWAFRTIGVTAQDRLASHAPFHFDLSVFDLFVAAYAATTVVLVGPEESFFGTALVDLVDREGITVWYSVPSALTSIAKVLLSADRTLGSLRAVLFAGEVYATPKLRQLQKALPHAQLWNLYGPTETNVCTYHRVRSLPADDSTIPIGRPCENYDVFAITESGRLAGPGQNGELYASGPAVMKGYWGRPDLDAGCLVNDPRGVPGTAYRTGDIVRIRADGDYEFIGRRDMQVKSRGFRVELAEIETCLRAHPKIVEAFVIAVPHVEWNTELVAHIIPQSSELDEATVRRHAAQHLPRYMIPQRILFASRLPYTSTGKIDRVALTQLSERRSTTPSS